VIDWFQPWPESALFDVAKRFLDDVELGKQVHTHTLTHSHTQHTHTLTHSHTHTLTLSHTNTHARFLDDVELGKQAHTLSLSHTHSHTHTRRARQAGIYPPTLYLKP